MKRVNINKTIIKLILKKYISLKIITRSSNTHIYNKSSL